MSQPPLRSDRKSRVQRRKPRLDEGAWIREVADLLCRVSGSDQLSGREPVGCLSPRYDQIGKAGGSGASLDSMRVPGLGRWPTSCVVFLAATSFLGASPLDVSAPDTIRSEKPGGAAQASTR